MNTDMMNINAERVTADSIDAVAGCQNGRLSLKEAIVLRDALTAAINAPCPTKQWWVKLPNDNDWYGPYEQVWTGERVFSDGTSQKDVLQCQVAGSTVPGWFSQDRVIVVHSASKPTN